MMCTWLRFLIDRVNPSPIVLKWNRLILSNFQRVSLVASMIVRICPLHRLLSACGKVNSGRSKWVLTIEC